MYRKTKPISRVKVGLMGGGGGGGRNVLCLVLGMKGSVWIWMSQR